MRRDYFALDVSHGDDGLPTAHIDYDGPTDQLADRLEGDEGERLHPDEVDVAFRLRADEDDEESSGVLAVTNRVTGEFIVELNADAETVFGFIRDARECGQQTDGESRYVVSIAVDGEERFAAEKSTLLVYDAEGELRRSRSLIPSGVEL